MRHLMSFPMSHPMSLPMSYPSCSHALSAWGEVRNPGHSGRLRNVSNLASAASLRPEPTSETTSEATPATSLQATDEATGETTPC